MYNHWGEVLLLLFCFVPFRLFLTYNPYSMKNTAKSYSIAN